MGGQYHDPGALPPGKCSTAHPTKAKNRVYLKKIKKHCSRQCQN